MGNLEFSVLSSEELFSINGGSVTPDMAGRKAAKEAVKKYPNCAAAQTVAANQAYQQAAHAELERLKAQWKADQQKKKNSGKK